VEINKIIDLGVGKGGEGWKERMEEGIRTEITKIQKRIAVICEEWGREEVEELLEAKRRNWKKIWELNWQRTLLTYWRGEKWIRRIWKETQGMEKDLTIDDLKVKEGVIYIIFNTKTKKVYIGETKVTLYERINRHHNDAKNQTDRKCYNYMKKIGMKMC
jgi:hypothetical protein